jgi:nicotinamide-nucleotide amidase
VTVPPDVALPDAAAPRVEVPASVDVPELVRALRAAGRTLAVAESLTGGLVAAALTDVPGVSAVFRGSVTAYATEIKARVLGVDATLLAREGAVHPEVAAGMADGVRQLLRADYGVATTGVAGPEPQDGRAVGTVYVAVAAPRAGALGWRIVVEQPRCVGDRSAIRAAATRAALRLLARGLPDFEG